LEKENLEEDISEKSQFGKNEKSYLEKTNEIFLLVN